MLMPLIYMKSVFEVNYSRKLSGLKNRLVVLPSDQELSVGRPTAYLYWRWAFESPPNVKLLVRQELGEEKTPQASQALTSHTVQSEGISMAACVKCVVAHAGEAASQFAPPPKVL